MAEDNRYRQDQSNQDWRQQRDRNREQDFNASNENKYESGFDYDQRRRMEQENNFSNTGNMDTGGQYGQQDRFRNQRNDWNRNDWNSNQNQWRNTSQDWNQRNSSQDWNQRNTGSGYGSSNQYGRRDYDQYGSGYQGNRENMRGSVYGDDTRNYGNANQSAFDRNWWEKTKDEVSSWFGDNDAERRRRQDEQTAGEHKGKGPRGYQRSEERIKEDVCDRLCDHPAVDATNINIEVSGTEVVLTGTVTSKDEKRRAEDIAESVSGVRNVENRIRVDNSSTGSTIIGSRDSDKSKR